MRITIEMFADTASFETDLKRASRTAEQEFKKIVEAGKTIAIGIVAGVTAAGIALEELVRRGIDTADQMGKLAQKTGITTEALSALKYSAELANVPFETLSDALIKFNKSIVEAQQGSTKQKEAFLAVGITLDDLKNKKPEELFNRFADAMAGATDDATKTDIALRLIKGSGADLIPFLNQGSKGFRDAADEAKRFGLIVGDDAAKQAAEFNDTITRIKAIVSGLGLTLARDLLPYFEAFVEKFKDPEFQRQVQETVKGIAELTVELVKAAAAFGNFLGNFGSDKVSNLSDGAQITALTKKAEALRTEIDHLEKGGGLLRALGNDPSQQLAHFRDELAKTEQQLGEAKQRFSTGLIPNFGLPSANDVQIPFRDGATSATPAGPKTALHLPDKGASDDLKVEIERIKTLLADEKDAFTRANAELDLDFRVHKLSIQDFYGTKLKLLQNDTTESVKLYDREIADLKKFIASEQDGTKQQEARVKLLAVEQEKRKILLDTQAKQRELTIQETEALKAYNAQVENLNISLLDLAGKTEEAAKRRFELANVSFREEAKAQGDQATLDQIDHLEQLTVLQARYNELKAEATRIQEDEATAESKLNIDINAGVTDQISGAIELGKLRDDEYDKLKLIGGQLDAIAANSGIKSLTDDAKRFDRQLFELKDSADVLGKQLRSAFTKDVGDALASIIDGTKSVKSAFHDLLASILSDLSKLVAQRIASGLSAELFGGGSSGSGSDSSGLLSGLIKAASSYFGSSGSAGSGTPASNAYGGDLNPGQWSWVGENGPELIVPRGKVSVIPNSKVGGNMAVTNVFNITAPGGQVTRLTQLQIANQVGKAIAAERGRRSA